MKNEEWRPVVGYEGLYEVSNTGRVRSTDIIKQRSGNGYGGIVLKPSTTLYENLIVSLYDINKVKHTKQVSRLVAEAFIPNTDYKNNIIVRHKDGNRRNNNVDNLYWSKYGTWKMGIPHISRGPVYDLITGKTWDSVRICSEDIVISKNTLYQILNGNVRQPKGHHLMYVDLY